MKCPICSAIDTIVRDSRGIDDMATIRRRRHCPACGFRFTTFERPELKEIWVTKKHGGEEPFDKEKLARSIKKAMHKHEITNEKIDFIITKVTRRLELSDTAKISTQHIGEMVLQELRDTDPVAYVRFASIYEDFHNIEDFIALVHDFAHNTNINA